MPTLQAAAHSVRAAVAHACRGLVEREVLVELIALAAVAREHVLLLGPPGTAKSEAARRAARALDAVYFEYLLGRFTEPSEIFGPIDLRRLREGVLETEIAGMLPEAEIAFLDEVFLGSTAILNTLLGVLHERTFRRGRTAHVVPLRVCIAASNAMPEDEALAAFADRFLLRAFVEPVADAMLEDLLEQGDVRRGPDIGPRASLVELDVLADAALGCDLGTVRPTLAHAVRVLRKAGVVLSDRRTVKLQRLIAAAAALDGRLTAHTADLWPIVYALPTADAQAIGRAALAPLLGDSQSTSLPMAALDASRSGAARATRLVELAREILASSEGGALADAQRARLEGVARDIDAGFALDTMPSELAGVREQVVRTLGAT